MAVLSPSDAALAAALAADPRTRHLVSGWPRAGVRDAQKRALMARVRAAVGAAVGPTGGPCSTPPSSSALEAARLAVLEPPLAEARDTFATPPAGSDASPRPDPYAWLRDDARKDPRVLKHLAAENAYTASVMADADGVVEGLAAEMRAAMQEADASAPLRKGGFYYYWRTEEGAQYRVSCRRRVGPDAPPPTEADAPGPGAGKEEVVLDENADAAGHEFYMASGATVSPDGTQLAWGVDTTGSEAYTLRVRNLDTGADVLAKPIKNTAGNYAFSSDGGTLLYTTKDALDRPYKVKHTRRACAHPPHSPRCLSHFQPSHPFFYRCGATPSATIRPATSVSGTRRTKHFTFTCTVPATTLFWSSRRSQRSRQRLRPWTRPSRAVSGPSSSRACMTHSTRSPTAATRSSTPSAIRPAPTRS